MKSIIPWRWGRRKGTEISTGDFFDRFWDDPWDFPVPSLEGPVYSKMPALDVSENEKAVTVRAEIPGLSEKDLDVTYHEGLLTIRGEKKEEKEEKKKGSLYKECSYGSFCRQVPIGENADWNKVEAKYKKGVLTITVPKKEAESKNISINIK
ncbi:Hsp20/alpha crystallin family protein [Fibrobacterota bacterium]